MWAIQSPDEKLDWHQDWTGWMESGDEISASSWEITPADGVTLSGEDFEASTDFTTVFVEGLTLGQSYQLKNTITTTDGRTAVREITLRCQRQ